MQLTHEYLSNVAKWLKVDVDDLNIEIKDEPITKFNSQIDAMLVARKAKPISHREKLQLVSDNERTNKILNLLQQGAQKFPVFVEKNDPYNFILEGRHRLIAFYLNHEKIIPVAYVSKKIEQEYK